MHGWSLKEILAGIRRAAFQHLPLPDLAPGAPAGMPSVAADPPDFGGLSMEVHAPPGLRPNARLVVLLHGCTQDPGAFAAASGWRDQALALGFVLLVPGQSAQRNQQRCFSWFDPAQVSGPDSEGTALCAMIGHVAAQWRCDPAQIHIVGFSAGGAMAAVLMASHPRLFVAGAVVAGLPAAAASGLVGASTRMAGRAEPLSGAAWAARARALAPDGEAGPWPRLVVWHGTADAVVQDTNGLALAAQWCALHGFKDDPEITKLRGIGERRQWRSTNGDVIVTILLQDDLGHAYPIQEISGFDPFVVPSAVSATDVILKLWDMSVS